jgi:hypothetical protein
MPLIYTYAHTYHAPDIHICTTHTHINIHIHIHIHLSMAHEASTSKCMGKKHTRTNIPCPNDDGMSSACAYLLFPSMIIPICRGRFWISVSILSCFVPCPLSSLSYMNKSSLAACAATVVVVCLLLLLLLLVSSRKCLIPEALLLERHVQNAVRHLGKAEAELQMLFSPSLLGRGGGAQAPRASGFRRGSVDRDPTGIFAPRKNRRIYTPKLLWLEELTWMLDVNMVVGFCLE